MMNDREKDLATGRKNVHGNTDETKKDPMACTSGAHDFIWKDGR